MSVLSFEMAGTVLIAALILDLLLGDPAWLPHPIVGIGRLISALESVLLSAGASSESNRKSKRVGGAVLVVVVVGSVYLTAYALLSYLYLYSAPLFIGLSIYLVWASLSIRSLGTEARAVATTLETKGIESARVQLARIVGRDTATLSKEEII
ncbi:MAG: cobalamin biosynthesis protein, partial [Proteobacteria bacterium]|nr:cobalamin biosynthesis protein [Pseudomonadota bacterium]